MLPAILTPGNFDGWGFRVWVGQPPYKVNTPDLETTIYLNSPSQPFQWGDQVRFTQGTAEHQLQTVFTLRLRS